MTILKFAFRTSECNGWPKVNILIDNDLYHDHQFSSVEETVVLPIELLDGDHLLEIEIYGKTTKNTILDSMGNIISDQLIELVDIYVDDIKLPDWFKYLGIYTYNNQELPRATIWGCNGSWHWEFKMPMITWIIDKKFEHAEKFNPPEIPQVILAEEKLKRFKIITSLLDELSEK